MKLNFCRDKPRLGLGPAESSAKIKTSFVGIDGCSRESHANSSLVEVRAIPDKLSWFTVH